MTYTCTTDVLQTGIVRVGIALAHISKSPLDYNNFDASVATPAADTSSFVITVSTNSPTAGMRTAFFLIVIKNQATDKMIDFAPFSNLNYNTDWGPGTAVDDNNIADRTITDSRDITTLPSAIFSSGTNIIVTPFVTAFKMQPPLILVVATNLVPDESKIMEYILTAVMSVNTVTVSLLAKAQTKISLFKGIVLLHNPTTIASVASAKGWNMTISINSFSSGSYYNLTANYATWGPNFNSKCIFGHNRMQYQGSYTIDYYFTNTTLLHYESYHFDTDSSSQSDGEFFCFGNGSECGQGTLSYLDPLDLQCYSGSGCPLPVFSGWASTSSCPMCVQLICLNCSVSNRSNCLTCGPNSTLSSGKCVCNSGYWLKNTSISSAGSGQWNWQWNSLTQCRQNCTSYIANCKWDKCDSNTYCTQCVSGYIAQNINSTDQNCVQCSSLIADCKTCSDWTKAVSCSSCNSGYYPKFTFGSPTICDPCSNPLPNCLTCTSSWAGKSCDSCISGYILTVGSYPATCICNQTNLPNCLTCLNSLCTQCNAGYIFNPTDSLCYPCSSIHSACLTCSALNICDSCNAGYIIVSTGTGNTCASCGGFISNCTDCSSTTVCTNCDFSFGLTLTSQCQSCSQTMYKCNNCQNLLFCLGCESGYFLLIDRLTVLQQCKTCLNVVNYCQTCDGTVCTACMSPYLIGPDGTCSLCLPGYQLTGGICTQIAGCQSSITLLNGTQICLSCDPSLYYILDSKLLKCVCIQGFKEFYQVGLLPTCQPVCGDGIILAVIQDCDDKNTISGDGCDSSCKVQSGFDCAPGQPSTCILQLNFKIIVFNYVSRVIGQNSGILSFTILPAHSGLQKMAWNKLVKFNFSSIAVNPSQLKFSYSYSTSELQVTVPYGEQLQNIYLQSMISLDPKYVVSDISTFVLQNKLNGVNAPLIFEPETMLSTHQTINTFSLVMMILLLLQFYVGSYFHKMIGLETIQVIQSIYFVRMVSNSKQTSLLNSMNLVQYSASGYQNSQLLYGSPVTNQSDNINPQFLAIGMNKNFLMNVNISLFPLILIMIVYLVTLARKNRKRNEFIETKEQHVKDSYTNLRRSCQWVYDHLVFPNVMMFNSISFFNAILQLSYSKNVNSPDQPSTSLQIQSSAVLSMILFVTFAIYCYQIFSSYHEYSRYAMTKRQRDRIPMSIVEKLQHDENNNDRANYHPLYVFVYLLYNLLLSVVIVLQVLLKDGFDYSLEMVMGLSICYLILICVWKPYHSSIGIHNHFLKLYYATFVLFTVVCYMFSKVNKLSSGLYISLMYIVMGLLTFILIGGFLRIFFQRKYRRQLDHNSSMLQWKKNDDQLQKKLKEYEKKPQRVKKIQTFLANNHYAFKNQVKQINKKSNSNAPLMTNPLGQGMKEDFLNPQQEQIIVNQIKQDIQKKRQQIDIQNWKQEIRKKHQNDPNFNLYQFLNENDANQSFISNEKQASTLSPKQTSKQSPKASSRQQMLEKEQKRQREEKIEKNKRENQLLRQIKMRLRSEHAIL